MNFEVYLGGSHQWSDASAWSSGIAPISNWSVNIGVGTVTATGLTLNNDVITITDYYTDPTVLDLNNTTIGADTLVAAISANSANAPVQINMTGNDTNKGTISVSRGVLNINGDAFTNKGLVAADGGTATFGTQSLTNAGTLLAGGTSGDVVIVNRAFDNTGLFEIGQGASATVGAPGAGGPMTNRGTVEVQGNAEIYVKETQTAHGVTKIDGGTLKLDSSFQGGTIAISSGMLEFGAPKNGPFGYGVGPAQQFTAAVDFTGTTGTINFAGYNVTSEFVKGHALTVYGTHPGSSAVQEVATIRLAGGHYSTSDFQVSGSTVTFAHALS